MTDSDDTTPARTDGTDSSDTGSERTDGIDSPEGSLPDSVVAEAERLTRLARNAVDPNERAAYERERGELLETHGYRARVREQDRAVLVCYPAEWLEDGVVQLDRVENLDRGIERPLEGPGPDDWETVETHNRELAETVEREHGPVHGANAHALADYAGNHHRTRFERLTDDQLQTFLEEYFPRNAWPTDDQRAVVEESIRLALDAAGSTERRR